MTPSPSTRVSLYGWTTEELRPRR